ncbi:MAG: RNA degradosome polyphosphate kinase, partial [Pseudomonadota bacterium]
MADTAASARTRKKKADLRSLPERFLNRELSWLQFNERVLEETANPDHPLLERLRFLSISASNLDEFYMVRYAGLREQVRAGLNRRGQDGLTPAEQVSRIEDAAGKLMEYQQDRWQALLEELADEGVHVLGAADLSKADRSWLKNHFELHIFPIVTPLAVDPAHPFPFLPNLGFAIAVNLQARGGSEQITGLVPLPAFSPRFIRLPETKGTRIRYIPLEDVLLLFLDVLYPGYKAAGHCLFRVVRDSDIEIEEEAEDLIREFEILLKRRRRGKIVRIKFIDSGPKDLRDFIIREIEAEPQDVVMVRGILGMTQLSELIVEERADLLFPAFEPRYPERIREMGGDCFAAVRAKDILVHHPYESFDVVVQFIRQA